MKRYIYGNMHCLWMKILCLHMLVKKNQTNKWQKKPKQLAILCLDYWYFYNIKQLWNKRQKESNRSSTLVTTTSNWFFRYPIQQSLQHNQQTPWAPGGFSALCNIFKTRSLWRHQGKSRIIVTIGEGERFQKELVCFSDILPKAFQDSRQLYMGNIPSKYKKP